MIKMEFHQGKEMEFSEKVMVGVKMDYVEKMREVKDSS